MLRLLINKTISNYHKPFRISKRLSSSNNNEKDEDLLRQDINLSGIYVDKIDEIMSENLLYPSTFNQHYPKLNVYESTKTKPFEGHNVAVIQPWSTFANFNGNTDPELQLEECVSLGNTIHNWKVIDKSIIFSNNLNRKHIFGSKIFDDLKETLQSKEGLSAVFFGIELLSGIQLLSLENELKLSVYDRFTVVLNIFRQHAQTKEAKLQVALAEIQYIRSHLRGIHESSEYSSTSESLKALVGGTGEKFYHQRLNILKKRENRLKYLLNEVKKQRQITKKQRRKSDVPTVAIVGYTNCGKTSLIKYLTHDEDLVPKDQLFATLDVSVHIGQLLSSKNVFYYDTIGFISRIPPLLMEAFSATLKDVQESNLIVHLLDVTHPDHKLQYVTVIKALEWLKTPKYLLESRLTIGNKADMLVSGLTDADKKNLPKCDLLISVTKGSNLPELTAMIDKKLMSNLKYELKVIRVENGGAGYHWLRKNASIVECNADETDGNYLICRVFMSPAAIGRWCKNFGSDFINP